MKKSLLALAIPVLLIACKGSDEFTIHGEIKGLDGKKAFLEVQNDSTGPKVLDTVKIENGHFTFEGKTVEPSLYAVSFESLRGKSFFIGEAGDINLKINKDSLMTVDARGTLNNDKMTEFTKTIDPIQKEAMAFQKANMEKMKNAQMTKDTVAMNALRNDFMAIRTKMDKRAKKFITDNPKTYVAMLLIKNRMYGMSANLQEVDSLYNVLDPAIKNTKEGKSLGKRIKEAKSITIGKMAPDFSAKTPEGNTVSLRQSLGKVTIIDFWASWCKPCRQANPEMVKLYSEYKDKGLKIIGVSLDKDAQAWKNAIAKDGLTWTQISNLKEWEDPIAKQYNVEAIPALFVLNEQGLVVDKDVHGEKLKARLEKLFNPAPPQGPTMPMPGPPPAPKPATK